MGTRLRIIVDLGGDNWLQGQNAVRYLKQKIFTAGITFGETREAWLTRVFKSYADLYSSRVPVMWLFREPRRVETEKSRYKSVCKALGIGGELREAPSLGALLVERARSRRGTRPPTPAVTVPPTFLSPQEAYLAQAQQAATPTPQQGQFGQTLRYSWSSNWTQPARTPEPEDEGPNEQF